MLPMCGEPVGLGANLSLGLLKFIPLVQINRENAKPGGIANPPEQGD
jgi:hypothetical protein